MHVRFHIKQILRFALTQVLGELSWNKLLSWQSTRNLNENKLTHTVCNFFFRMASRQLLKPCTSRCSIQTELCFIILDTLPTSESWVLNFYRVSLDGPLVTCRSKTILIIYYLKTKIDALPIFALMYLIIRRCKIFWPQLTFWLRALSSKE